MEIWAIFTGIIAQSIELLSSQFGVSQAIAIILFTLLGRFLLMPINTLAMIKMYRNKKAISAIKPQLESLKVTYKGQPGEIGKRTMALYKKHNIQFLNKTSIANIATQGIFGFGMFQTLQQLVLNSKFAWIASIAKPDILLAILVGALTYFSMLMMPGSTEQANALLFVIPALISVAVLISFPSAIGLYWATSNSISCIQSFFIKKYFDRQDGLPIG